MTKEHEQAIHQWAVEGGQTVAFLPPGMNVVALQAEKVKMTTKVADLYGVSLTKKMAKALITAVGGELIGSALELILVPQSDPSVPPMYSNRTIAVVQTLESLGRQVAQEYEK